MLITDSFVFLHSPKTGGSFVTAALRPFLTRHSIPFIDKEKRGAADTIPDEHKTKPIVTLTRTPFDYFASHYRFGYWINRTVEPHLAYWDEGTIAARFSSYPYLTFAQFMEGVFNIGCMHLPRDAAALGRRLELGPLTVRTLQYSVAGYIDYLCRFLENGDLGPLIAAVAKVRFLHTESLNLDVYRWLVELGANEHEAATVLQSRKVQPLNTPAGTVLEEGHGQPRTDHWTNYFSDDQVKLVRKREWLFFALFPEYDWPWPNEREAVERPHMARG